MLKDSRYSRLVRVKENEVCRSIRTKVVPRSVALCTASVRRAFFYDHEQAQQAEMPGGAPVLYCSNKN